MHPCSIPHGQRRQHDVTRADPLLCGGSPARDAEHDEIAVGVHRTIADTTVVRGGTRAEARRSVACAGTRSSTIDETSRSRPASTCSTSSTAAASTPVTRGARCHPRCCSWMAAPAGRAARPSARRRRGVGAGGVRTHQRQRQGVAGPPLETAFVPGTARPLVGTDGRGAGLAGPARYVRARSSATFPTNGLATDSYS